MVRGLDKFAEHFKGFEKDYVLIGGTACELCMNRVGLSSRITKDLDIVLILEGRSSKFISRFWDFIRKGGYNNKHKSSGKRIFYRFDKPKDESFPAMIEIFSRNPEMVSVPKGQHLIPIPADEEISSLSAILLDDDYYGFILDSKQEIENIPCIPPTTIIPLKAKAYLDLSQRKREGLKIDDVDVKKHRNDVFRLSGILPDDTNIVLKNAIRKDFRSFLQEMSALNAGEEKAIGNAISSKSFNLADELKILKTYFNL
ncbi:MAG TPA: hypothetical protein DET40_13560 [Lentisphaeria bacterium]|nr:MAG: hypothetical protein A2X45_01635 [Lentisphaerae bacterium GWF2_50_93]HCE44567.1 hypothetical protein [Lentisphaeria bacterium]